MLRAPDLATLLRAQGLRLTKRRGQHHLVDTGVIERIVRASRVSGEDTVVEVGAGLGALTEALARQAKRVIAVEVDRGVCALLQERLARLENVSVICQDILTFAWRTYPGAHVVGAIPYQITSPLLAALAGLARALGPVTFVVQDEVAKRLAAAPGGKAYGRLTLLAQSAWEVKRLFRISRRAFFPQPNIESAVVRLTPRRRPAVRPGEAAAFAAVVAAAFGQRRKTLVNSLTGSPHLGLTRSQADTAVQALGLPLAVRGETLSLEQFAALTEVLSRQKSLRDFP